MPTNIIGSILFPRKIDIGGIPIDTIVSEGHQSDIVITKNPVEFGLAVTDNIVAQPYQITVEGVITPIVNDGLIAWGLQGAARRLTDNLTRSAGIENGFGSKVNQAWQALLTLQRSGERLTVVTGLKVYPDMVIIGLSSRQDKDSSQHLRFSLVFSEIVIINTGKFTGTLGELEEQPESRNMTAQTNKPTADRGQPSVIGGTKAGEVVTEDSNINESELHKILYPD